MPGGITDVLERVLEKHRPSAKKGSYEFIHEGDTYELYHYRTRILTVNRLHHTVSGGYGSVSSSGAINKALSHLNVPCHWSYGSLNRGFWCDRGWTGTPSGPKHVAELTAQRNAEVARKKAEKEQRKHVRKVPGYKYGPVAEKKMRYLQRKLNF